MTPEFLNGPFPGLEVLALLKHLALEYSYILRMLFFPGLAKYPTLLVFLYFSGHTLIHRLFFQFITLLWGEGGRVPFEPFLTFGNVCILSDLASVCLCITAIF